MYILLAEYGETSNAEASLLAWPEISAALAIDDRLSNAHASWAILLADFDWNWGGGGERISEGDTTESEQRNGASLVCPLLGRARTLR